jgi:hypothetical protein
MNKYEYSFENYKCIQELIRFADQKAGAILVIYGFLLTMFFEVNKYNYILNPFLYGVKMVFIYAIGTVFIFLMLLQMYFIIFKIIFPGKSTVNTIIGINNCLYYEYIASISQKKFIEKIKSQTDSEILYDMSVQLHETSKILKRKMDNIRIALIFLFIAIIFFVAYILLINS